MRWLLLFPLATVLTACNFGDTAPKANVAVCWSDDVRGSVEGIIVPHLRRQLGHALEEAHLDPAPAETLSMQLSLQYQHAVKADLDVGAVQCNATGQLAVSDAHGHRVTLSGVDVNYAVYPGQNGPVTSALPSAFDDALSDQAQELLRLDLGKSQSPAPAPSGSSAPKPDS